MGDNNSFFYSTQIPNVTRVPAFMKVNANTTIKPSMKSYIKQSNQIDMFYDNRKNIYDICGNVINKDKYPFIGILSK